MRSMKLCAVGTSLVLAAFVAGSATAGKPKTPRINAFIQKSQSGSGDSSHDWNHDDGDDDDQGEDGGPGRARGNDFALFDGSNPLNQPDAGAVCGALKGTPFTFNLAVANYGSAGFVRVTYADGDWIQFPIAAQGSFSMSQAAGSRGGNDAAVRVSNGGSGAQLAGTLSAQGGRCASCDADGGLGDAGCDALVAN
ncbi:MAG TPA: hypothetical protein VMS55_03465 [Myxococcota bacterium]|nr:hypothetical protein [Myxococcota bacterium]